MQKGLVAILLFSLFQGIICYCSIVVDPFTFTLEQLLSDVTFEIVPYQTYPNVYPPCQNVPCPSKPCVVEPYCGYYPEPYYCPIEFEKRIPPCPTCLDFPCGMDSYSPCSCYRDIRNPCIVCDNTAPLCICFECDNPVPPYIYFPEMEYPMGAMDIKPYYYGNCWCT